MRALMHSMPDISRLECPSAVSFRIWRSRKVSDSPPSRTRAVAARRGRAQSWVISSASLGETYVAPLRTFAIAAKSWVFLTLSALAAGGSWLFYFRALQMGDASRVAPLDKLSLVFVALIGTIFLGERLSLHHWAGIGLVTAGIVLVAIR